MGIGFVTGSADAASEQHQQQSAICCWLPRDREKSTVSTSRTSKQMQNLQMEDLVGKPSYPHRIG
jgi:hypothetical protein